MTLTDKAASFARTETEEGTVGEVPEMIERVARAMFEADLPVYLSRFPNSVVSGWEDEENAEAHSDYRRAARAAIAAMAEPTEPMWSNLARQIVMWHRHSRPTGANLHRDLKNTGWPIPDWLAAEIEDADYVPPKGAVAIAIYRAQIAAALGNTEGAR